MSTSIRAFTLTTATQYRLDQLKREVDSGRIKLPARKTEEAEWRKAVDEHALCKEDYDYLYTLLMPPIEVKSSFGVKPVEQRRLPNLTSLIKCAKGVPGEQRLPIERAALLSREIARLQRANRKGSSYTRRDSSQLSMSSLVDRLLVLGMEQLTKTEGVASLDVEGSKRKDASQGGYKLSNRAGRKEVAVPAV